MSIRRRSAVALLGVAVLLVASAVLASGARAVTSTSGTARGAQPNTVILHNQTDTFFGNVVCSPTGAAGLITITYNAVVHTTVLPDGTSIFHLTQGGGDEIAYTNEGVFTAHFTLVLGSTDASASTTNDVFEIHGTAPNGTTFHGHFNTETTVDSNGTFHLTFNSVCF